MLQVQRAGKEAAEHAVQARRGAALEAAEANAAASLARVGLAAALPAGTRRPASETVVHAALRKHEATLRTLATAEQTAPADATKGAEHGGLLGLAHASDLGLVNAAKGD